MEIKERMFFRSKHFKGRCFTLHVRPEKNELEVSISRKGNPALGGRIETWNLEHTKVGFKRGDYFSA